MENNTKYNIMTSYHDTFPCACVQDREQELAAIEDLLQHHLITSEELQSFRALHPAIVDHLIPGAHAGGSSTESQRCGV